MSTEVEFSEHDAEDSDSRIENPSPREASRDEIDATKAQLEIVIKEANVGLWDWDIRTDTSYLSAEWKRQLGYEEDEVTNLHQEWTSRLHPDDRSRVLQDTNRALRDPENSYRTEFRLRHKDGSYRWIRSIGIVLRDCDGEPYRKVGCHIDITDLRNAEKDARLQKVQSQSVEQQLRDKELQLSHASRLSTLGEVVAGVAHELNQPLQAIEFLASACDLMLASDKPEDRAEVRDMLRQIRRRATTSGDIVKGLRSYSKRSKRERATHDINQLIRESIEIVKLQPSQPHVSLELSDGIPGVFVDPIEIQQVIINLVQNAVDAVAQSDATEVFLRSSVQDEMIYIEVEDYGSGIPDEFAQRVFEAFSTTKEEGLGLGLAICKRIMDSHNGKVSVESMSNPTRFSMRLPAANNMIHARAFPKRA